MRKFTLELLKPFRFWIMAQFSVGIIWALDASIRPYILKLMIDKIPHLNSENVAHELLGLVSFYLSMSLLITIVFRFYDFVWLKLNPPLKRHIGDTLMKRMMDHSLIVFHNQFAGSLANKIKDVMSGIPDLLRLGINQFFSHSLALIIAIVTVWTIDYKFSALLFIWVAVFIGGSAFFSRRAKKLCAQAAEIRSGVVGQIVDILSNISSVHLFSAKKMESKTLRTHLDQ